MNRKIFAIGILTVTALLLGLANLMPVQPATAATVVKDNRYQMITTRSARGGEALYVIDNLTGQAAVFGWDNNNIVPLTVRPLTDLFSER
jgi:hypothetical protein